MKSMATIMYQLQTALKVKGYIVTLSTTQFYSSEQDRFIKVYHLKKGRQEIVSTASQIVIIRCLKQILDCIVELEANRVPKQEWEAAVQENLSDKSYMDNTNIQ